MLPFFFSKSEKIFAYNLQRLARQQGKAVIAATTHPDLLKDLAPNVHIHKRYGKEIKIKYRPKAKAKTCNLTRQMRISEGTTADYKALSPVSIIELENARRLEKFFTLKRKNETCGVIVYSYPSPLCFGRCKVWKGNFTELQKEVSIISRVIVHPKYRSIGLGEKLVAETLQLAGTPNVETVAVMAKYNPFFEKAGMQKIAESTPSPAVTEALAQLEQLGFDPTMMASVNYNQTQTKQVGIQPIQTVLTNLSQQDPATRKRLANLSNIYPRHQEFQAKIQKMNAEDLAKVLKRLSFAAQTKAYLFWTKPEHPPHKIAA